MKLDTLTPKILGWDEIRNYHLPDDERMLTNFCLTQNEQNIFDYFCSDFPTSVKTHSIDVEENSCSDNVVPVPCMAAKTLPTSVHVYSSPNRQGTINIFLCGSESDESPLDLNHF